jgi:energy-coupling factor transporter ATP-binding protein EcfA2
LIPDALVSELNDLGFEIHSGPLRVGDRSFPLVQASAIDRTTGAFALVVAPSSEDEVPDDAWRELFFAVASLRIDLSRGRGPALSAPVVLVLLADAAAVRRIRLVIEELTRDYLLFTRLDVSLATWDVARLDMDRFLCALLPKTRRAVREGSVVGFGALEGLASELRQRIEAASSVVEHPALHGDATVAAAELAERVANLITDPAQPGGATPSPVRSLELQNVRSFARTSLQLSPFTLVEGRNGTGKSTLLEALEIAWSGSSSRRPPDVDAGTFDDHLRRGGIEPFSVVVIAESGERLEVTETLEDLPGRTVRRSLFLRDLASDIARDRPVARYDALLEATGLYVPSLDREAAAIRQETKVGLNRVLARIDARQVAGIRVRGVKHVCESLSAASVNPVPQGAAARTSVAALAEAAREFGIAMAPVEVLDVPHELWEQIKIGAGEVAKSLVASSTLPTLTIQLRDGLMHHAEELRRRADSLRRLASGVEAVTVFADALGERRVETASPAARVPSRLSRPWRFAADALRQTLPTLERHAKELQDLELLASLERFIQAGRAALEAVPRDVLAGLTPEQVSTGEPRRPTLSPELMQQAGFQSDTELPGEIVVPMRDAAAELSRFSAAMIAFAEGVARAPAARFADVAEELRYELARFEVGRSIEAPVAEAQGAVLGRLVDATFGGVLDELVAGLTRFDWYFHPLRVSSENGELGLSGMAVERSDRDVRMMLNAGERSIVAIAWFLALFVLQPSEDRRVLILDDPFVTVDSTNQAAGIATLRSLVRIVRPEQLIVASHDPSLADALLVEMGELDGWPRGVSRVRVDRDANGLSRATVESELVSPEADISSELSILGLGAVQ